MRRRLYEAWQLIAKAYLSTGLNAKYQGALTEGALESLKALKKWRSRVLLIARTSCAR